MSKVFWANPSKSSVRGVTPMFGGGANTLKAFGADSESFIQMRDAAERINTTITNGERPSNFMYRFTNQTAYWYQYAIMDWYVSEVSVLSTIILRSCTELLRYGLEFVPKFAYKCERCGYESETYITKCPKCGCIELHRPRESQKEFFKRPNGKSFLDEANDNGQSLKDVLKQYAELEYRDNQAYMLCVTGEITDEDDGELLDAYPLEFLVQDPKFVRYLYDETGKSGTKYAFVRENRNSLINLDESPGALNDYSDEGKVLYPAYWQIGTNYGATGNYWLYAKDEVYQDKWFRQGLLYGEPIWFDIEDDLLTYHYLEKHNLKKYKFGYIRKIVILPGFNDEDAEDIAKGVRDVLATNDTSIPIICTPPQMPGVAEQKAQTLELGSVSADDDLKVKNDVRDRLCAHCGVPNIFAGDVESSGGMNNESQQITTFDRYLMDKYEYLDRLCKWIMSWFPRITDWALVVSRPSKAYTDFRKRMDELQFIQGMKQMGFDVFYQDGLFRYSDEPVDQVMRRQQEAAQAQAGAMAPPGGLPEGANGHEELPDKGTDRRDEPDIGASKKEVDQAMDEGQRGMEV